MLKKKLIFQFGLTNNPQILTIAIVFKTSNTQIHKSTVSLFTACLFLHFGEITVHNVPINSWQMFAAGCTDLCSEWLNELCCSWLIYQNYN